jgi:hypothetical protein
MPEVSSFFVPRREKAISGTLVKGLEEAAQQANALLTVAQNWMAGNANPGPIIDVNANPQTKPLFMFLFTQWILQKHMPKPLTPFAPVAHFHAMSLQLLSDITAPANAAIAAANAGDLALQASYENLCELLLTMSRAIRKLQSEAEEIENGIYEAQMLEGNDPRAVG